MTLGDIRYYTPLQTGILPGRHGQLSAPVDPMLISSVYGVLFQAAPTNVADKKPGSLQEGKKNEYFIWRIMLLCNCHIRDQHVSDMSILCSHLCCPQSAMEI